MAKFLGALVLILVAAAVVFYFGWVQIRIPAGTHAVLHTRTGGFEDAVVPSGVFIWRWERLIPHNMTIYPFTLAPMTVETQTVEGTLPSGETYAALMEGNPSFSYKISLLVTVSLRPEALSRLVREDGLEPSNLEAWIADRVNQAAAGLTPIVLADPSAYLGANGMVRLEDLMRSRFEDLEISSVVASTLDVPDPELYAAARAKYLAISQAQETHEVGILRQQATTMRVLEEYGKLLEQYPVLLQYLYLQELKGNRIEGLNLDLGGVLSR